MNRNTIATVFLLLANLFLASSAVAQNYRFQVVEMELEAFVQPDASVRLQYKIVFANDPNAHAIDIVDVGLPHAGYNTGNMSASVDGTGLGGIRKSEYIDIGVEVPLGAAAIRAGNTGDFRFECTMPDMVYQDTTDKDYASLQIKPTWFDPNLQTGSTHLRVAIHLPPGVTAEEVRYQNEDMRYQDLAVFGQGDQQHVVAAWQLDGHRLSQDNPKFSVSFPKRGMERVVRMTAIGLLVKWFAEAPEVRVFCGIIVVALLALLFFRFSHGTGWVLFLLLAGLSVFGMVNSPGFHLLLMLLILPILIAWNEWYLYRRRHRSYLPAMATVEGAGIKRGLTAPKAAVLLELPLSKVLTLVIFGLLKKGVLRMVSDSPLRVEVSEPYRCGRKERRKHAGQNRTVIHNYEQAFIDRLIPGDKPVAEYDFNEALGKLIRSTAAAMKGYDLSDTQEFYRRIVAQAWKQAEAVGEVEQRDQKVDQHLEWMMMDPEWTGRFDGWGRRGYHYRPSWTRSSAASSVGKPGTSTPPSASQTTFGEVAASFAGWTENTAGSLVSGIEPASMGLKLPAGVVDLSSVDTATANFFEALAESGRSGGGGGGCACACAGCACACACAGGGR